MRRILLVGVVLVAIGSFLAMQAVCRPFMICAKMTCDADGTSSSALEACAVPEASCRSGCGECAEDGSGGMDFGTSLPCAGLRRPCMPAPDFSADNTCCEKQDLPSKSSHWPNRALSCVYCIPARFLWEPPSVHAIRDLDISRLPAAAASIALTDADQALRQIHAHSPPVTPTVLAGADRRISNCSLLL